MNPPANDPFHEVDSLVQAYLNQQATQVDGAAGLARVRAAMRSAPKGKPAWRRTFRFMGAVGVAAAIVLVFFSGRYLSPAHAGARDLVEEVKRVHNQPLARCYLVEIQRIADEEEPAAGASKPARRVRVWTRGDRFWVEMQHGDASPFIWGRGENGTLWAVLDSHRGVRIPLEQAPKALQRLADLCTLNVDTLLDDVLQDCSLTDDEAAASKLTRVVVAEPRSERARQWLGQAALEIDTEAKVLRRMVLVRNLLGSPQAKVTFTLLETRPDDDADYHLEGHLTQPVRVYEGNVEPKVKLELLARWFGARQKKDGDAPAVNFQDVNGKAQTPLSQPDKKATVFFFLLPDCPISNSYAPEIQRICADYEAKKIAAFVVHGDPDVTVEKAKKHAKEYGLTCPVLLDPTHVLVKKAGATMAPEVAVLAADGKVLYRGRIDDWYAAYGKRRAEPTQRDLRNALDAIVKGQAVASPVTQPIGCYLPDPKK